ncbi:hypothetical protein [uncultured Exiguobacterium sp.]|uniref:hypothetical protein n=1 Tax=uncultured Exiguobacterium sp. TaxID=202669 RepID=UPI0025D9A853|nr:hypothetical protein [uncultured Exiguobacterium sp.]
MLDLIEIIGMRKQGKRNRKFCLVKCSYCGKTVEMRHDIYLRSQSCGCLKAIKASKTALGLRTHKSSRTRLYSAWQNMKMRCFNPNNNRYDRYGGRGITVCEEWKDDFVAFQKWALENGYDEKKTIDRIDNDKGYSPDNCRWATGKEQSRNRSTTLSVDYEGANYSLVEVAELSGVPHDVLKLRYRAGDRGERLVRPVGEDWTRMTGEKNANAKITAEIALDIKQRLAKKETAVSIAASHGISKYLVYDIKRGKTWKHITVDNTEVTD